MNGVKLPPQEWRGHYVVDGECVACGHKANDLEVFTFVTPPPEVFWDEEDIKRMPRAIRDILRRIT